MITWQFLLKYKLKAMPHVFLYSILSFLTLSSSHKVSAQSDIQNVDISPHQRAAIVSRVANIFEEHYVYEGVAKQIADYIRQKLDNGEYNSIENFEKFISQLTEDLQYISHDQHCNIYRYQKPSAVSKADSIEQRNRELAELRRENFGFRNVEILPGNIGYANIFQFYDPKDAAPTAIAAMNFLANCDALVIDLRENGGGHFTMCQLICSYFFDAPTRLIDHHYRDGDSHQEWTLPFVPGPKMTDIPIYVLVSRRTFSAAEGFAFCLKNRGRATIIGERTRGGAHPVEYYHFPQEAITIRVPYGRAADPATDSNWEGTGVEPDIQAPAFEEALIVANIEALKKLVFDEPENGQKYLLEWALDDYNNQLNPIVLDDSELSEYAGDYGVDKIIFERGTLYYRRHNHSQRQTIPMGNDGFRIYDKSGYSKYRIQFLRNSSSEITGFYLHAHDGDKYSVMTIKTEK